MNCAPLNKPQASLFQFLLYDLSIKPILFAILVATVVWLFALARVQLFFLLLFLFLFLSFPQVSLVTARHLCFFVLNFSFLLNWSTYIKSLVLLTLVNRHVCGAGNYQNMWNIICCFDYLLFITWEIISCIHFVRINFHLDIPLKLY